MRLNDTDIIAATTKQIRAFTTLKYDCIQRQCVKLVRFEFD